MGLSPEEEKERKQVALRSPGKNPFVHTPFNKGETWDIGFYVPRKPEPLWWTGSGFKDLSRTNGEPEEFPDKASAERKIRSEILGFIEKWRGDQVHLIVGWR